MQDASEITADNDPSDADLRRFDIQRQDKTASNAEWVSTTDPDAEITRMKDGTTTWLQWLVKMARRYVITAADHKLDRMLETSLGSSKPRENG